MGHIETPVLKRYEDFLYVQDSKDEPLSRFPLCSQQLLDDDSLKLYTLKQVTTDIEEHLDGATDALLGEILDDESIC